MTECERVDIIYFELERATPELKYLSSLKNNRNVSFEYDLRTAGTFWTAVSFAKHKIIKCWKTSRNLFLQLYTLLDVDKAYSTPVTTTSLKCHNNFYALKVYSRSYMSIQWKCMNFQSLVFGILWCNFSNVQCSQSYCYRQLRNAGTEINFKSFNQFDGQSGGYSISLV